MNHRRRTTALMRAAGIGAPLLACAAPAAAQITFDVSIDTLPLIGPDASRYKLNLQYVNGATNRINTLTIDSFDAGIGGTLESTAPIIISDATNTAFLREFNRTLSTAGARLSFRVNATNSFGGATPDSLTVALLDTQNGDIEVPTRDPITGVVLVRLDINQGGAIQQSTLQSYGIDFDAGGFAMVAPAARIGTKLLARNALGVPGADGPLANSFTAPSINSAGHAAFRGGFDFTTNVASVILRSDGVNATPIAFAGGATNLASAFGDPVAVNSSGQVAYVHGGTSGGDTGIYRDAGGAPVKIARRGDAAAGGGTFGHFMGGTPVMNETGLLGFVAGIDGVPGITSGVFRTDGSAAPIKVARITEAAPNGGTFASFDNRVSITPGGQVGFMATLSGTSGTGIFRGAAAGVTEIARTGAAAPGSAGGAIGTIHGNFAMSSNGSAAFVADITGSASGQGVFRGSSAASLIAIARAGDVVPSNGAVTLTGFSTSGVSIMPAGRVAFRGLYAGGEGIFTGAGGAIDAVAKTGQSSGALANGGDAGTFTTFGEPAIALGGQAAFMANIGGASDASTFALYLADATEKITVARHRQQLGGGAISSIDFRGGPNRGGIGGLNDNGQIVFRAGLGSGTSGTFLFTPELHYRNSASGSWDTANNWTVGLKPASVHDVVIDPVTSLTVTGPAADTTVQSLRIGGQSPTAIATLNISAGGDLVTGRLAILSTGKINVTAGVLRTADFDSTGGVLLGKSLIVDYDSASPLAELRRQIINGTNGASAPGAHIRGPDDLDRAVGYAEAADVLEFTNGVAAYEGQSVDETTALVRYTLRGDGNLDGSVGFLDLLTTAANFGLADAFWANGDYNHDGQVGFTDLLDVASRFGQSAAPAVVPEPGAMALMSGLLWRRRKRR